ncbi:MAG: hypothetical protein MZU79_01010 [Anaerotruncus sp.]|nr:hypothetical protein [Anaerotruncus sp.]
MPSTVTMQYCSGTNPSGVVRQYSNCYFDVKGTGTARRTRLCPFAGIRPAGAERIFPPSRTFDSGKRRHRPPTGTISPARQCIRWSADHGDGEPLRDHCRSSRSLRRMLRFLSKRRRCACLSR